MTNEEIIIEMNRCRKEGELRYMREKAQEKEPRVNEYEGLTLNEMRKKFYARYGPTPGVKLDDD